MDHTSRNRFQPYARPPPRRQQPEPAILAEENFPIPQVIVSFIKKSLSWLGITQDNQEVNHHPAETLQAKTPAGASTANNGLSSSSSAAAPERLYPDLREYISALKSPEDEHGFVRHLKRSELEYDAMSPARIEHRHKLRKGLMDSLSNTENEQEVVASPMVNPFLEPTIGSSKKPLESAKESLERSLASRHDSLEAEVQDEEVDGLSKQELIILGRIRRMADTPLEASKRRTSMKVDHQLVEQIPVREPPSPHSVIRRIHQETESKARQAPKLLDTILPYNKDYRRQRPVATTRDGNNDYAMHSGDSGSDADESEHATKDHRDRSKVSSIYRQSRFREKGQDGLQSSPERRRRTSRPELQEDLRTSRGGLQIRSQVTPQRHPRRHIPGRFSALDSDEEDEALRQHESDMQRRSQEPSSAGRQEHLDRYSGYKVRPQIYPTLQYGLRTKLYNPKLDDVLKWTSSALDHTPAASSKAPDHHKVTFAESVVSEVVSAAPAVLGALTAAAGLTGAVKAVKAVSNWDAAGFKMPDQSGKWTCPTCDVPNNDSLNKCACCDTSKPGTVSTEKKAPALPSLFGPPSSSSTAPAETNKPPATPFLFGAPPTASASASTSTKDTEKEKEKPAASTAAPTLGWAAAGFKMPDTADKWKCPTCDVMNDNNLGKCPCCDTNKPGGGSATATTTAAPALFSFKPPASTSAAPTLPALFGGSASTLAGAGGAKATPSLFGAAPTSPKEREAKPPMFSFTAPSATSSAAPAVPLFGAPSSTATSSTSGDSAKPSAAIAFANPFATKPLSTSPAALFGSSSTPASSSSAPSSEGASKPAPVFTFGNSASSAAPTSTPLFGAPSPSTSLFGGPSPSTPLFGGPTATLKTTTASTSTPPLFGATTAASSAPLFGAPAATSAPAATTAAATTTASVPLFGAASSAAPPLFGATLATSKPLFGAAPATSTATSTPLFGAAPSSTAPASASLFGAASSAGPPTLPFGSGATTPVTTSAPSTSAPLFSLSTMASSSGGQGDAGAPAPLFGTSAAGKPTSPFTFGSSTTAGTSALTSTATPTSAPTSSTGFGGAGFGGFGAAKPLTTTPFSTTPATTPAVSTATSGGFVFGGGSSGTTVSQGPSSTSFTFGNPSGGGNTGGFGSSTGSTSSPFMFGGGGSSNNANSNSNSMMSPTMVNATPATTNAASGGFGSAPTLGFGGSAPSIAFGSGASGPGASGTPGVGFGIGSTAAPSMGFGAAASTGGPGLANPFGQNTSGGFGTQSGGFGAQSGGFGAQSSGFGTTSTMGGGNTASTGFGSGGFGGGFGAGSGAASGMISLAGPGGQAPAFGAAAPGGGFGSGLQTPPSQQGAGGFGGFGTGAGAGLGAGQGQAAGGAGQFGFQNMSNAPGGAQYAAVGQMQQPAGGFSFNMGAGPAPGEVPANRKIAKMRSKKR